MITSVTVVSQVRAYGRFPNAVRRHRAEERLGLILIALPNSEKGQGSIWFQSALVFAID